jgi:hypothetical protein
MAGVTKVKAVPVHASIIPSINQLRQLPKKDAVIDKRDHDGKRPVNTDHVADSPGELCYSQDS